VEKTALEEYVFIPRHIGYFQMVQLCQEVVMSVKKHPGKPKQYCQKFQHIWLQHSEIMSWLGACPERHIGSKKHLC